MSDLASFLPFTPTADQSRALGAIGRFLANPDADAFVLCGAAGTGKTSVTRAITEHLASEGVPFHVLAPTGRAAKIIGEKTGVRARTVHSAIYTPSPVEGESTVWMVPKANGCTDRTVFVVDEASMLSNRADTKGEMRTARAPLADLVRYVKEGNARSQIVFVGDAFQLPPVGEQASAALDPVLLQEAYGLRVHTAELREVMRQASGSYIMENALRLREAMESGRTSARPRLKRLSNEGAQVRTFLDAFDPERPESATMLAYTNRDVNRMNRNVRARLGTAGPRLAPTDRVVLQRPWRRDGALLVGGEQGTVLSVGEASSFGGLSFAEVRVAFDGDRVVDDLALLDTLTAPKGSLRADQERALLHEAIRRNPAFRESRHLSDDPHAGALRLRHGFALTVHKAQGGEWDHVYLHPYLARDSRWVYTAVTRARKEAYSYRHPYPSVDMVDFMA